MENYKVLNEKGEVIEEGTPTQIAHKGQAIKRTFAVVLAALILANGIVTLFLEVFGDSLEGTPVAAVLGSVAGVLALCVLFLQRLMVMESLQDFLIKVGLGTGVEKEDVKPITANPPQGEHSVGLNPFERNED